MRMNPTLISIKKPKWFERGLTQASYAVNGGEGHVRYVVRLH